MEQIRKAGRPLDRDAAERLKKAALRLVREKGYAKVSVAEIIAAAQVSRQTMYNRWAGKSALIMEAFYDMARDEVPMPDHIDNYETALADFLSAIFAHLARDGEVLRHMIAAAQTDPGFRDAFWQSFVAPREVLVTDLLRRAQNAGALAPQRDVQTLTDFIHGAFWYRLLNGQPLQPEQARAIAAEIFAAPS
ncbi:TetR/AcrR family transcriptional regulator [Sagittula sp. SSi028]|uniref:TetR/AcrR family transcriptional regulator n=1 Tax=Sagittula sp. SSi028 TaxID=3400636 RepID=UPI003AF653DD